MYAIAEIQGKQYRIEKDQVVSVDKMNNGENKEIVLDKILLYANGDDVRIGQPYLSDITVKAAYTGNVKGDKIRGIKFKKRKGYTRTYGFRPEFSQLTIKEISAK